MKKNPASKASVRLSAKSAKQGATAPQDQPMTPFAPSGDDVAHRAYLSYQYHGSADGHDVRDWLGAEEELIAEHHLTLNM